MSDIDGAIQGALARGRREIQVRIGDDGELELAQPVTWDGEPVYCRETVQEGLFDRSAFEQIRGQMALEAPANGERCYCPDDCNCRKPWRANYCGCRRH